MLRKQWTGVSLAAILIIAMLASCGTGNTYTSSPSGKRNFDESKEINVISREEGSGTRGAFIELFGIEQKDESGDKVDMTTDEAMITNNTSVMMTTVAGNKYAIGYISLGSLNDTVKAVQIDGAAATSDNIMNKTYKIARPFHIATKGTISEITQDFINFIMSSDGQEIVEANGYIAVPDSGIYSGNQPSGKVVVAGSSSVSPILEKLKEAYLVVNPNASVEVQQSDSTTGMTSVMEGICDIGMASRSLKQSELDAGLSALVIAQDGIAVIVNNENPISAITSEQVRAIFTGETTEWSEISE